MDVGLNTYLVLLSAASIGISCALIGCYVMLYKKSLVSDAAAHATLPGIAIGFFVSYYLGLGDGRFLPILLAGGALSGYACSKSIEWMTDKTRLYEDTAIASSLAFFFGAGLVLFSIIQNFEGGTKTGLDSFLFGQIAGTTTIDAATLLMGASLATIICILKGKSFVFFSFDKDFAFIQSAKGQPTKNLLMLLMLLVVCIGLKTVGAILILAMLIFPPAIGRLLQNNVYGIILISVTTGFFGAVSGAILSLHIHGMPTGPAIIMSLFALFLSAFTINIWNNHARRVL